MLYLDAATTCCCVRFSGEALRMAAVLLTSTTRTTVEQTLLYDERPRHCQVAMSYR